MTETYEQWLARRLSVHQWEFLIDHFESEGLRKILPNESPTRVALTNRKLIRMLPLSRPTHTKLTTKGRAVTRAAMGLLADMLVWMEQQQANLTMEKYGYGRCPAPADRKVDGEISVRTANRS